MPKTSSSRGNISSTDFDGLTVKEVAFILKVDPKTVYGWCSSGKIQFFRVGGKSGSIRIKKEYLGHLLHINLSLINDS